MTYVSSTCTQLLSCEEDSGRRRLAPMSAEVKTRVLPAPKQIFVFSSKHLGLVSNTYHQCGPSERSMRMLQSIIGKPSPLKRRIYPRSDLAAATGCSCHICVCYQTAESQQEQVVAAVLLHGGENELADHRREPKSPRS